MLSQGMCTFVGSGQELYRQVMMTNAWLNRPEEQGMSEKKIIYIYIYFLETY